MKTEDYIDTLTQSNIILCDHISDEPITIKDQNEDYPLDYYLLKINENNPSMR